MKNQFENFDAARHPLNPGVNFIEASAGTGKTYAITMLVLRSIVELKVPIDKILIVTFTKAATEELNSRIREKLLEVRNHLNPAIGKLEKAADSTVAGWISSLRDQNAAASAIEVALHDIDRSGVCTIHSFCHKMLREQTLESGQLFEVELLAHIDEVVQQVVEDFWRARMYPITPLASAAITSLFPSPESLYSSVSQCLGARSIIEPESAIDNIETITSQLESIYHDLSRWWMTNRQRLHGLFLEAKSGGYFKKGVLTGSFEPWFQTVDRFFSGEYGCYPKKLELLGRDHLLSELHGNKLRGVEKKTSFLKKWPLADELIYSFLDRVNQLTMELRLQLAATLREQIAARLELRGKMGFDDLVEKFSSALKGSKGSYLRKTIGDKFTVALIDEFQDTDMDQYHIFSSLFHTKNHYLYLIGDPKQAIYKFRGADIFSYFQAREQAQYHLTLQQNYRSHPYLIDEINRLFSSTEKPFWFSSEILSYREVGAAIKSTELGLRNQENSLAGIVYCQLQRNQQKESGRWSSGAAADLCMNYVISQISRMLGLETGLELNSKGEKRDLRAGDIAVLVRTNNQAEKYRNALLENNIPAIIVSKQSVFETRECRFLYMLLLAIAADGNISRLKTAMTIPWFGLDGDELHAIWDNQDSLGSWYDKFLGYHLKWQEEGVMPMMIGLLEDEDVFPNLAKMKLAERSIVNINQLLDLLQNKESTENFGTVQLLQWLQIMMRDGGKAEDSQLLLESDNDAVQLVTIHGAKGLEYPVVFCPYLWYRSQRLRREKFQIQCFEEGVGGLLDLGTDTFEQRKASAIEEDFAEDLRLLYVAVTRARVRCHIVWADVQAGGSITDSFNSALGYLLFSSQKRDHTEQVAIFSGLAARESVSYESFGGEEVATCCRKMQPVCPLEVRQPGDRSLHTEYKMSSFSGLVALTEYGLEPNYAYQIDADMSQVGGLPAGPHFGNLIHDLLEENSFREFDREPAQSDLAMITDKCQRYGVQAQPEDIFRLLQRVVTSALNDSRSRKTFSLAGLSESDCLKEMNFYFQVNELVTGRINDILAEEKTYVSLGARQMRGYLTGFIDLLCRIDGKYYIVDYKTNFLGNRLENYSPENLIQAMAVHNYGLQYWIYTLVVHRYLKNLATDYHYEKDFGGVLYLFLRGLSSSLPDNGVFYSFPDYKTLQRLERVLGEK